MPNFLWQQDTHFCSYIKNKTRVLDILIHCQRWLGCRSSEIRSFKITTANTTVEQLRGMLVDEKVDGCCCSCWCCWNLLLQIVAFCPANRNRREPSCRTTYMFFFWGQVLSRHPVQFQQRSPKRPRRSLPHLCHFGRARGLRDQDFRAHVGHRFTRLAGARKWMRLPSSSNERSTSGPQFHVPSGATKRGCAHSCRICRHVHLF